MSSSKKHPGQDPAEPQGAVDFSVEPLPAVPPSAAGLRGAVEEPPSEPTPRVSLLRQVTAAQVAAPPQASPAAAPAAAGRRKGPGTRPLMPSKARPSRPSSLLSDAPGKALPEQQPPVHSGSSPYVVHTALGTTAVPQQAHPQARNLLRRMMEEPAPPTTSFNIVDRLVGSPYANPKIAETEAAEDVARPILIFALDLAETMIRWGASALDVETSVIAVTTSVGLRHVDIDITNQSVHLNWAPPEGMPASILRVVRSSSDNFAGLSLVHQLVGDITAGRVGLDFARSRLRSIRRRPKPYNKPIVIAAGAIFAGLFVLVIGGTPRGAFAAVGSALLVTLVTRLGDRWRIPSFFSIAAGTAVATITALILYRFDWLNNPELVVAGGIMLLLPSGRFVSAVQDAINGFPVTAVGRLFSAMIVYGAIIAGVMFGAVAGVWFDLPQLTDLLAAEPAKPTLILPVLCLLVGAAVVCGSIVQQVAPRYLMTTSVIAVTGYLVTYTAVHMAGTGERLAPAVAAVVMGLLARLIGLRIGTTPLVLAVPAIVILLPGLAIFRSMYGMALQTSNLTNGLAEMFTSFTIILGVAAGVALGDTLARPLTRDWNAKSRKRIRRR